MASHDEDDADPLDLDPPGEESASSAHLAHFDALTNLPNRLLFEDRLGQAIAQAARSGEHFALHHLELDQYESVESLGGGVGDGLLQAVAARLGVVVRKADTFARLSGGQFAVIQRGVNSTLGVTTLVQKLLELLSHPFAVGGREIDTGARIGIALFSPGVSSEALTAQAARALSKAKLEGHHTFRFDSEDVDSEVQASAVLHDDLHAALERGEFFLEYQPQVDLATGRVVAAEALVRWRHPRRGILHPVQFVAFAEEVGLIVPLGSWILEEACRQLKAWNDDGLPEIAIAVNVSAVQFRDPGFCDRVITTLETVGLSPTLLDLEFTETILLRSSDALAEALSRLHERGIKFSIDDFGTGYSSLRYLRLFPVHKLKIAMEFVQEVPGNSDAAAIVDALVSLGHKMALQVVAEGVETEDQAEFLRAIACDSAQGYYFSQPEARDVFAARLAKS